MHNSVVQLGRILGCFSNHGLTLFTLVKCVVSPIVKLKLANCVDTSLQKGLHTTLEMKLLWEQDGSMHIRDGYIALINNVSAQLGPSYPINRNIVNGCYMAISSVHASSRLVSITISFLE